MPVDPNHRYADEAHPSTMTGAGWRYACWTLSDEYRRDRPGVTLVQDGWTEDGRKRMVEVQRNPKQGVFCGHTPAQVDKACNGCVLYSNSHASQPRPPNEDAPSKVVGMETLNQKDHAMPKNLESTGFSRGEAVKTVTVIFWKYCDGSGCGIVRAYDDPKTAELDLAMLREHCSDWNKDFELVDVERICT